MAIVGVDEGDADDCVWWIYGDIDGSDDEDDSIDGGCDHVGGDECDGVKHGDSDDDDDGR